MRHKIFLVISLLSFTVIINAQQLTYRQWLAVTRPALLNKSLQIDCTPLAVAGCNTITNNVFNTTGYDPTDQNQIGNPFGLQLVDGWQSSHGSANVYDGINYLFSGQPPFPGAGFTRMGAWIDVDGNQGEGIAQKIPALTPGRNYGLSFFLKRAQELASNNNPVQQFYVVLMHCTDYDSFNPSDYLTPPFTANSQIVYCETNLFTTSWKQVFNSFIANSNYNMIWIFPKTGNIPNPNSAIALFAYPELVDLTVPAFSAGTPPIPVYPNCIVTLGPSVPNCSVKNSVFTWTGPGGQTITAPASQQIQVDAGNIANAGIWTLSMSVPTAVNTNNACSQQVSLQASVAVPYCQSCMPTISPAGPIDYYVALDLHTNGVELTSDKITGNQWYYNGTPISAATSQKYMVGAYEGNSIQYSGSFYVINNGCQSNTVTIDIKRYGYGTFGEESFDFGSKSHPVQSSNYHCHNTTSNPISQFNLGQGTVYSWKFPVRTNAFGTLNNAILSPTPGSYNPASNQMQVDVSAPTSNSFTYLQGIADLNGRQVIIDYYHSISPNGFINPAQSVCATIGQNIVNWAGSSYDKLPGNSGFDWESYNFGTNGLIISGPGAGQNSVTIAGRSSAQPMTVRFSGPSTVTKNFYYNWGGCYKEQYGVTLNNGCRPAGTQILTAIIYPNPTSSEVIITANDTKIEKVILTDFMNTTVKQVQLPSQKSITINLTNLQPGIYNCQITTQKGIENQKLIIRR